MNACHAGRTTLGEASLGPVVEPRVASMSGPRPPFIALRERLSKTVREVAQNAQTAFNELGSLDAAAALVSTASLPAVPRHTDARTPGAEEVIRLPVSAARKLRFYDRAGASKRPQWSVLMFTYNLSNAHTSRLTRAVCMCDRLGGTHSAALGREGGSAG